MPDRSKGLHVPFIKRRLPDWTQHLHSAHLEDMTDTRDLAQRFISVYPDLFDQASPMLRQRLLDSQARSNTSIQQLARTLKDFKGITEFCKPLLIEAMRKKFGQTPDVDLAVAEGLSGFVDELFADGDKVVVSGEGRLQYRKPEFVREVQDDSQ